MNTSDQLYEVLGVSRGVSRQELKAAYRDLTKVWHPDRFTHDPRLQQKAQEKLKEINDAYEQLISGKPKRRTHQAAVTDYGAQWTSRSPVAVHKSTSLTWIPIFLILFGSVFVFTIRLLHTKANRDARIAIEQNAADTVENTPKVNDASSSVRASNETSLTDAKIAEQQSMPTITVVIDSATGLLARSECPTTIRMTYRSGNEPRSYCNLHPANETSNPNHQSKLKSLKKTDSSADDSTNPPSAP